MKTTTTEKTYNAGQPSKIKFYAKDDKTAARALFWQKFQGFNPFHVAASGKEYEISAFVIYDPEAQKELCSQHGWFTNSTYGSNNPYAGMDIEGVTEIKRKAKMPILDDKAGVFGMLNKSEWYTDASRLTVYIPITCFGEARIEVETDPGTTVTLTRRFFVTNGIYQSFGMNSTYHVEEYKRLLCEAIQKCTTYDDVQELLKTHSSIYSFNK